MESLDVKDIMALGSRLNDTPRISVHATQETEDYRVEVFLHCLDSKCSKIKLITINILFMKIRQLVVRRIPVRSPATCESALKPCLHISRKDRKHMFANTFFKLSKYGLVSM